MTLIKSISGIRGTIGGVQGDNLTPTDIVKFASAYAVWLKNKSKKNHPKVVIGRDARISGPMVINLVNYTLVGMGIHVINLELSTTPTVEMEVVAQKADGGIIITASHNPKQWNALKLLNEKGEFISAADGQLLLDIAESSEMYYVDVDHLGTITHVNDAIERHIEKILHLPLVDQKAIENAQLKIVVDGVNSSGSIAVPQLLKALGVGEIIILNEEPNGHFAHNPEPLPENLQDIAQKVKSTKADFGIVVDPDVDRLAFVNEDGSMFGEEYTLVAIADYILSHTPGNTVSNLSSSMALRDVTLAHKQSYNAAAVGEVNVVVKMKETHAVIGGEGNGGIIYPALHYGRDAMVGIALFLTHYVKKGMKLSELRNTYPQYVISKNKIELTPSIDVDHILAEIAKLYANYEISTIDGVKIDMQNEWIHLRKSNTEPIIRIYSESATEAQAEELAQKMIAQIKQIAGI